jgi:isovaleryl-CoA dehydrogenase
MKLRADKKGDRYVLNGSKMWITNGPDADTLVVYAKTDLEAGARHDRLHRREGLKGFVAQNLDKLGMRGSTPASWCSRLRSPGGERAGRRRQRRQGADERPRLRARVLGGPLGIMQACMDVVVPYVHERKQFGQAIGEFQLMQGKLADMYTT